MQIFNMVTNFALHLSNAEALTQYATKTQANICY